MRSLRLVALFLALVLSLGLLAACAKRDTSIPSADLGAGASTTARRTVLA